MSEIDRAALLAAHLEIDTDDVSEGYGDELDAGGLGTFLVLSDDEAGAAVFDYVRESVWAFNADFLAKQTDVPAEMFEAVQEQCEGANDAILPLIERTEDGLAGFVAAAVEADGRGHFLAGYDGEEIELVAEPGVYVYAYRVN